MGAGNNRIKRLGPVLEKLFEQAAKEGVFSGAAVGVQKGLGRGRKKYTAVYGKSSSAPRAKKVSPGSFFDLASLTKPLGTTLAVLCLIKEGKTTLCQRLTALLDEGVPGGKEDITLWQLLNHCSGLPAHRPYYEKMGGMGQEKARKKIYSMILKEPLAAVPGTRAIYSDLGFMLLGRIIEKKSGKTLADYLADRVMTPLGLEKKIFFSGTEGSGNNNPGAGFVATRYCSRRHRVICGEVDDNNAAVMGGTAGHAGLFGDIEGVLALTSHLLEMWHQQNEHPGFSNQELACFFERKKEIPGSSWALGFDTPSFTGSSSGRFLSAKSVGHLGFTGTSFWIDYKKELVMVLLTNRVHPGGDNSLIRSFRPLFHDTVVKSLFSLEE
ncbi:MAG: serine hydrolase [Desulfobacterales bacterium]|nr:serine hydrolase [Desulfobacterales bacterium]